MRPPGVIDGHTTLPDFWEGKAAVERGELLPWQPGTLESWQWYYAASGAPPPNDPGDAFVAINGGAAYCFAFEAALTCERANTRADEMRFKNDDGSWSAWEPYQRSRAWTLASGGSGQRRVWMQLFTYAWSEDFNGGWEVPGGSTEYHDPVSWTPVYATIDLIARPALGGEGVDVLDATWTSDIHAGFQSADLTVLPPRGISLYADQVLDGIVLPDLDQHTLWEGRLEEPDITFAGDERRELQFTGYVGYLTDDEAFRRCYVASGIDHWQFDQATKYASRFSAAVEDEARLVLRVAAGSSTDAPTVLHDGMNARMYWRLFDGAGDTTERLRGFKFHYQVHDLDGGNLSVRLYGRDALSGGSVNRLLWTAPASCADSGDVTLDHNDIGSDIRCLVWKIEQVGEIITAYADLDAGSVDAWSLAYGIAITEARIYGSDLYFTITPEGVIRDLVSGLVDDDHLDFPDSSGLTIGSLYFDQFTTLADAIAQVNKLLDWTYGFDEGAVFYCRRPWNDATAPDVETIVVSIADPLLSDWNVRLDYSGCYNKVVAEYAVDAAGHTDTVTVSESDGPLGAQWRVKFLDLTQECDEASTAASVAARFLADNLWPKPTGSCTLKDAAHLACGLTAKAIHAKPGMLLYNMDVPLERGGGKLLITSVDGSLLDRAVTLNVGVRSNRMDRWMAGLEMKAKARKRRRRG